MVIGRKKWLIAGLSGVFTLAMLVAGFVYSQADKPNQTLADIKENASPSYRFADISFEPLKTKLGLMRTEDSGYGYLSEEAKNISELYSTYYAIKALTILEGKALQPRISEYQLLADPKKLPISEIYYFTSIFANELKTDVKLSQEITKVILQMRNDDNVTFAVSIEDKEDKQSERSFYYLSTFMALSSLHITDPDYDTGKAETWLQAELITTLSDNTGTFDERLGNLKNLIDIAALIDPGILQKQKDQLATILADMETNVFSGFRDESLELYTLSNFLNISNNAGYQSKITKSDVLKLVNKYRRADGGFSLYPNNPSNALPTYLVVDLLKRFDALGESEKAISAFIKRFQLTNGFYIPINYIESDIVSTYYAYQLMKLQNVDISNDIRTYLNAHDELQDHPYYWFLKAEVTSEKDFDETERNNISELSKNSLQMLSERNSMNELITVHTYLSVMKKLQIPIDKGMVLGAAKTARQALLNGDDTFAAHEVEYIKSMYTVILKDLDEQSNPFADKSIPELIKELESSGHDDMYFLYYKLFSIQIVDPLKMQELLGSAEFKSMLSNKLANCYVGDGLFSYAADHGNVSLTSTYFGFWLYKNIVSLAR